MGLLKQQMVKWVAVFAIRLRLRRQESLQAAADRRQSQLRLGPAFLARRCRGLLRAPLFQRQEAIRQHHHARVMVEPTPRPPLEMIQTQFFLHLLVTLLPSRQVTLRRGNVSARDFRRTGRGLSSARRGLLRGRPWVDAPGQTQRGSAVKTTISGVTPAM